MIDDIYEECDEEKFCTDCECVGKCVVELRKDIQECNLDIFTNLNDEFETLLQDVEQMGKELAEQEKKAASETDVNGPEHQKLTECKQRLSGCAIQLANCWAENEEKIEEAYCESHPKEKTEASEPKEKK